VKLKDGLLDPQGKAIADSLPHMGWTNVEDVRVGKHITFSIQSEEQAEALEQAEEIAHRLLANPVIEDVDMTWESLESIPLGGESTWTVTSRSGGGRTS
jgi:phosphoribosylformylglycinamidine synthase subunit PurS